MEPGVTVKVYGFENIKKQVAVVQKKMHELNRELGKLECALCFTAEIHQPPEETDG